jgi:putative tryptophan/tyrosine transport system ATP-binding protein
MSLGLTIQGVSKAFSSNGNGSKVALSGVSITIRPGEFVMIVGHNGSGKTTLLNVVYGELLPDAGTVAVLRSNEELLVRDLSVRERAGLMARVLQNPAQGVFRELRVWENLHVALMSATPLPFVFGSRRRIQAKYSSELHASGLSGHLDSRADALSGGERQMLALQMAILRRPPLLLLDEHTSSLDANNARWCMERTDALVREQGMTTVAVTHDLAQAVQFGDRLIVLREGRVAADLSPERKRQLTLTDVADLCGFEPRTLSHQ